MPIRTKLLLLLLGISLIPLGAVGWLGYRSTRQLGARLADESRQSLTQAAAERLEAVIDGHAQLLRRQGDLLEFIVREQARELETLLAEPPPAEQPVYFAAAFDEGTAPGLTPSEHHWTPLSSGRIEPLLISHHAAVVVAQGSDPPEADVARLAAMGSAYRDAARGAPESLFWQFAGVESGVLSVFPGHGGFPPGYDFREQPFYEAGRGLRDLGWVGPSVDPATGEVVLSLISRVRGPDGEFAGVTGAQVRVVDILGEVELPEAWHRPNGSAASVLLVTRRTALDPASDEAGGSSAGEADPSDVVIVGQQAYAVGGSVSWDRLVEVERLIDRGGDEMAAIASAILEGHSGQRRATFDGRDSIVAFGAMQAGNRLATLVLVVPMETVTAAAVDAQARAMHETNLVLRFTALTIAVVTLIIALVARIVARGIVRPIDELVEASGELAAGNFDVRVRARSRDEMGRLARRFNRLAPQLRDLVSMRSAMALAEEVQQNLLPREAPRVPGLVTAAASAYCDQTGGDYYDFLAPPAAEDGPETLAVVVGDVTGHGMAAALLMTTARALLRGRLLSGGSAAESVTDLNRYVSEDASNGRFVTLYVLSIGADGTIRWVSAGHDPALVYCPARDDFRELAGSGVPLGIDATRTFYEHGPERLQAGEIVVIGTDGVWEARNEAGEMFGKDRLRESVRTHAAGGADAVLKGVLADVRAFRGTRRQEDDITLVVVERTAARGPSQTRDD